MNNFLLKKIKLYINRLSIRKKILLSFSISILLTMILFKIILYSAISNIVIKHIETELNKSTNLLLEFIRTSITLSIENYLKAHSEKQFSMKSNSNIIKHFIYTPKENKTKKTPNIILESIKDSLIANKIFFKKQIKDNYYYCYVVQKDNKYHISCINTKNCLKIINFQYLKKIIKSIKFGKTGYCYVINSKGILIIHPTREGEYVYNSVDEDGFMFVKEICTKKKGQIVYKWKNPGEKYERKKLAIFDYIPELDWIVASSSYFNEFYSPIREISIIMNIFILANFLIIFIISLLLSSYFSNPIKKLIKTLQKAYNGDFNQYYEINSQDEFGQLAKYFNSFMEYISNFTKNLTKSEAKYRTIFENSLVGIFQITIDGKFNVINNAFVNIFGYKNIDEFKKNVQSFTALLKNNEDFYKITNYLKKNNQISGYELTLKSKNNTEIYVELYCKLTKYFDTYEIIEGFINDITIRKIAFKALEESEKIFRLIFQSSPIGMVLTDSDFNITTFNDAFIKIFNFKDIDIIKKINIKHLLELHEIKKEPLNFTKNLLLKNKLYKRKGTIYLDIIIQPLYDYRNKPQKTYLIIINDITQKKIIEEKENEVQKLKYESKAKSNFISTLSHELRTPLNIILGSLYLIERTNLNTQQSILLKRMEVASKLLFGIINDILELYKIDYSNIEISNVDFSLIDILNNIRTFFYDEIKEKKLNFLLYIKENTPIYIKGDPLKLQQIIINLVKNAIKFTDSGFVKIEIEPDKDYTKDDQHGIAFKVIDTGKGIEESIIKDIFNEFTRAEYSIEGIGLGLSIVKKLVNLMQGKIKINSKPNIGTEVQFTLPFKKSKKIEITVDKLKKEISKLNIAILSDDIYTREFFKEIKKQYKNKKILITNNKKNLQKYIINNNIDIIILDTKQSIPEKNKILHNIKKYNIKKPLVISMGTIGDQIILNQIKKTFIDAIITRPINELKLFNILLFSLNIIQEIENEDIITKDYLKIEQYNKLKNLTCLIVDDNDINLKILKELLLEINIIVETSLSAYQTVQKVQENHKNYDFIILDINMPDLSGIEVLKKIREFEKNNNLYNIPIFAITAYPEEEYNFIELGFIDTIIKPINPDILYAKLVNYFIGEEIDLSQLKDSNIIKSNILDIKYGLRNTNNNKSLYIELVMKLISKYEESKSQINTYLRNKQNNELHNIFHMLKGTSSNLGLFNISSLCEETINNLKNEQYNNINKKIMEIEKEFEYIKSQLRKIRNTNELLENSRTDKEVISYEELLRYLQKGNTKAIHYFNILKEDLKQEFSIDTNKIEELIKNFDFEDAYLYLKRIIYRKEDKSQE